MAALIDPATSCSPINQKLWLHFADIDDEEEMGEVEAFVNICYEGIQPTSHAVDDKAEVQWILLEGSNTSNSSMNREEDEETLVAVARLIIESAHEEASPSSLKNGTVDVLCAAGDSEKVMTAMLDKV
jgi:hypothetical protein